MASVNWVDVLFLVTVILLVFNGFRNGFVFSLINLISIPLGIAAAIYFGPRLTSQLAGNNLPATPLISYIVLFFGVVLILHLVGTSLHRTLKHIPVIGCGDELLGGVVGFVEAWLIWLILLIILGNFLGSVDQGSHILSGVNIQITQLQAWHDFYNQTVTNSLFAHVNSFFVKQLPNIPHLTGL
jgi:uncharacterized membrane protein required for colicin V production